MPIVAERPKVAVPEALRAKWVAFVEKFLIAQVTANGGATCSKSGLPGTIASLIGAWQATLALEAMTPPSPAEIPASVEWPR